MRDKKILRVGLGLFFVTAFAAQAQPTSDCRETARRIELSENARNFCLDVVAPACNAQVQNYLRQPSFQNDSDILWLRSRTRDGSAVQPVVPRPFFNPTFLRSIEGARQQALRDVIECFVLPTMACSPLKSIQTRSVPQNTVGLQSYFAYLERALATASGALQQARAAHHQNRSYDWTEVYRRIPTIEECSMFMRTWRIHTTTFFERIERLQARLQEGPANQTQNDDQRSASATPQELTRTAEHWALSYLTRQEAEARTRAERGDSLRFLMVPFGLASRAAAGAEVIAIGSLRAVRAASPLQETGMFFAPVAAWFGSADAASPRAAESVHFHLDQTVTWGTRRATQREFCDRVHLSVLNWGVARAIFDVDQQREQEDRILRRLPMRAVPTLQGTVLESRWFSPRPCGLGIPGLF